MSSTTVNAARAPFDRTLLLVLPATAFMFILFVYPFLYGLGLSFDPKEGGWLSNYQHFFTADDLDDAQACAAGDVDQRRFRAADRLQDARQIALSAVGDYDPRHSDHVGNRAHRRRHADLLRAEGMAVADVAILPSLRRADTPYAQLLGRPDLAGDLRISVRLPSDPVLRHRHRSGAGACGIDTRGGPQGAIPAHLPAAVGTGAGHVLLPRVRAG